MRKDRRLTSILFLLLILAMASAFVGCDRQSHVRDTASAEASAPGEREMEVVPLTNMVLVKAGNFLRGGHRITLTHDFWLGKYEVTQSEYTAVMSNNPSQFQGDPQRPVEKVKIEEAMAYCAEVT